MPSAAPNVAPRVGHRRFDSAQSIAATGSLTSFGAGFEGPVEDVVLRRYDGAIAYNLAAVVDDQFQGVDQVVRGDDLLTSTPTQMHLASLLGGVPPTYAHLPLVVDPRGRRLAKREGAATLSDLTALGVCPDQTRALILESLGAAVDHAVGTLDAIADAFEPDKLPTQ